MIENIAIYRKETQRNLSLGKLAVIYCHIIFCLIVYIYKTVKQKYYI